MSLSAAALVHMRPGRPRKSQVRMAGDRSPRESVAEIKGVVMAQRLRLMSRDVAGDPMAGHCLGRLRLASVAWHADPISISEAQYGAGERYAALAVRHAVIQGYQTGSPRAATFDLVGGGLSCKQEPDEETILQVRRQWSDAYRTLMDAGTALHRGTFVAIRTYDICLDRLAFEALDDRVVGDLRIGLNSLCKLWR